METNPGPRITMINTQPDIAMATPPFSTEQKDEDNVGSQQSTRCPRKISKPLFVLCARITLKTLAKIPCSVNVPVTHGFRKCTGLTKAIFQMVTESPMPFFCFQCQLLAHEKLLLSMKASINQLVISYLLQVPITGNSQVLPELSHLLMLLVLLLAHSVRPNPSLTLSHIQKRSRPSFKI